MKYLIVHRQDHVSRQETIMTTRYALLEVTSDPALAVRKAELYHEKDVAQIMAVHPELRIKQTIGIDNIPQLGPCDCPATSVPHGHRVSAMTSTMLVDGKGISNGLRIEIVEVEDNSSISSDLFTPCRQRGLVNFGFEGPGTGD